ncbi:HlyD family type I secretion periplasmic adaptor subunit [Pseudoalteromonas sp.]|uniref:HlyD family type I secretion periplasmic adaptor subunit n=1 Tax=Pseudoalteromonas sp. TaxID=53249 RepID=UPI003F9D96B9
MDKNASRKWLFVCFTIFLFGFGTFITWAVIAPLSSASIAAGSVVVKGNKKSVQHLEGGIIQEIHVEEGQYVNRGDVLFKLAKEQALNLFDQTQTQYQYAKAAFQRIQAELSGMETLNFSGFDESNKKIKQMLDYQIEQFYANKHKLNSQISLQLEKQEQSAQKLKTLLAKQTSDRKQLKIAKEQVAMYTELEKKGYSSRSQFLAAQSNQESIQGRLNEYDGLIQQAQGAINESELALANIRIENQKQLREVFEKQQELLSVRQSEYMRVKDVLDRTTIISPISGYVVNLSVNTLQGVISPRQKLLDIVPDNDDLLVEVLLNPKDIESVHKGMKAKVRLSSYNMRRVAPIDGLVENVSADRIYDEEKDISAYKVKVKIQDKPEAIELYPGMPAEVMILLEQRTPLDYLLSPLLQLNYNAFRESS